MKKTKIICSIGPVSRKYDVMKQMVEAGMNVARINFSHADMTERKEAEEIVARLNEEGYQVGLLFDTKGPDFRTGIVLNGEIELKEGSLIRIVKEDIVGTSEKITVNYKETLDKLEVGNIVLLEDGLMKLEVVSKENDGVTCKIISGGNLGNRKGVNVPGVSLDIPFISQQDYDDIVYACKHDGDFLALSFVSSKEDILAVRRILEEHHSNMQIIAKVESEKAISNLDEIIEATDGVMVARGDLGVEVPMKQLPILQKLMIEKCREKGKFCIVATEMLSSMQKNARPTRAEVSDIANAVLDGADAVMLSGETTAGKYPIESVTYMAEICENTEHYLDYQVSESFLDCKDVTGMIARSVVDSANQLDVKLIIAATMSGYTARRISTLRPDSFIFAGCSSKKVCRSLVLNWGVYPVAVDLSGTTDEVIARNIEIAKELYHLKKHDLVVLTGGFPNNIVTRRTNFLKIEEIL